MADAGAERLADFPWLRVTRPLTSFRDELDTPARRTAWLTRLARADAEARHYELENLPPASRHALTGAWLAAAAGTPLPATLEAGLADCRTRFNATLARDPGQMRALIEQAAPFDEYLASHRLLGLYPVVRHFVLPRIASHQAARRDAIARAPADGAVFRRYAVPEPPGLPAPAPVDLERDALGIPRPDPARLDRLFSLHAPVWAVATDDAADLPGALVATHGRPVVDTTRTAEYRHWSWTRFRGEVLVQLNYLIWFPERPPEGSMDIYAGHLDGLLWRVTLRNDGSPLAYESIHPCGCYYTVFPAAGWRVRPPPGTEPVLAPTNAPEPGPRERVLVRLASRTHYVAGVETTARANLRADVLDPLSLSSLRSLPRADGTRTSAFDTEGLIPSSRRLERFLLWPLGVRSPGAMRQWGTHAIAFVGQRHFDDPWLLDRLLETE